MTELRICSGDGSKDRPSYGKENVVESIRQKLAVGEGALHAFCQASALHFLFSSHDASSVEPFVQDKVAEHEDGAG